MLTRTTVAPSAVIFATALSTRRLTSWWIGSRADEIGEQADPRALQPAGDQRRGIGGRDVAGTERGDRIGGIVAGDHVEHARRVFDASG